MKPSAVIHLVGVVAFGLLYVPFNTLTGGSAKMLALATLYLLALRLLGQVLDRRIDRHNKP
jgi:4-hydroxybenzoate polyprenyltransferase